ncbi:PREDICTED: zinc transporter ZIP4-like [Cyprinodon variegatus]|uniref:zinc transporter ZIP4-like n=2 Tax=Cyprinodon variegatus TaxID=28743 RepID=UPI0007429E67|nr:PREDICTED: zinc transporter ZIP4-like [Cyprinodon variegatus]
MKPLVLLLFSICCFPDSVGSASPVEDAYNVVISVVAPGQRFLTGESLRSLFNTLQDRVQCGEVPCEKCDLAAAVDQLIGNHSSHAEEAHEKIEANETVSVSQFPALAAGSVLYLISPDLVCAAIGEGKWAEEKERFLHKYTHMDHYKHAHSHIGIIGLESVIQDLHNHYEPSDDKNCVTASGIMMEVDPASSDQIQEVGAVLGRVLYHALLGHCFGQPLPEESFFLDFVMTQLGSENFTVHDLEVLMKSLKIGPEEDHDHDHDHIEDAKNYQRKQRGQVRHVGDQTNNTWDEQCFTAEELVQIYGLSGESSGMGRSGFAKLSPALVQQILSGSCSKVIEPATSDQLSKTEKYLYATLANIVITLMAILGVAILLCTSCTSVFQMCIQFCISMAVGSLTGDALLHLIPSVLGLHVHSGDDDHDHQHEETPDYTYKMLAVIGGIYAFYLMESIFSMITNERNNHHEVRGDPETENCTLLLGPSHSGISLSRHSQTSLSSDTSAILSEGSSRQYRASQETWSLQCVLGALKTDVQATLAGT